ncbi:leucine-rich repeat and guanylate kinase domain-containing protein isoform X1 [Halyomorpha halys]|uniref:leucine-rich repeat and guanylate kinase domain-containing protein isoform X1 n=2 Tax=Halyomorpha halys TaxID=286706 RepID=UPI0034D21938
MEVNYQIALWNYFWSKMDGEKAECDPEIRTLQMLASIGYNSALLRLQSHLGENALDFEEKDEDTYSSILDVDLKSMDFETLPDLNTFIADSSPAVFDCEMESDVVVDVDYLTLPPKYEKDLMRIMSSDEEDDSTTVEDTFCFAYSYGGPEVENTEGWDRLGLLPDPWAEARHPTVQILKPEDLTEDEIEPNLTILTLSSGMGNLALTPDLKGYGYTKLQLPSKGIKGIELLQYYPYLQYVDLANNNIEDPSPLWKIMHLVVLDLSRNNLTDESIDKPDPIWFLTYLNLSHNKFTKVPDFSNCWSIKHFDLAHNQIERIEKLRGFKYLSYLNLSFNKLQCIEGLSNKLLKEINVSHNNISCWKDPNPKEIHGLENINISCNQLLTLSSFSEMYNLTTLDVSYNKISAMTEFDALKTLPAVTNLKIAGNQINTIINDSRRLIIYLLPSIKILDGVPVSSMERVSSVSIFTSDPMHLMVCQSMRSFYYSCSRNPTVGWERLQMTGDHPALIILIGDLGSSRHTIINMVQRMNPHICKEVKMTTTRPPVNDLKKSCRLQHITLKKFNTIEKDGGFVVVEKRLGHKWGLAVRELEDKHRVLLAYMGMTASLEVLWKGYNPTLIIMLPNKEEILIKRCLKWFLSSDVYRSMFKVRRVSKRENKEKSEQVEDESDEVGSGSTVIRSPLRNVKLFKCQSMFTNSGKKKWKTKRYTENLGLNKKLLQECYGKYLSSTPGAMKMSTSFDSRPYGHVSFFSNDQETTGVRVIDDPSVSSGI